MAHVVTTVLEKVNQVPAMSEKRAVSGLRGLVFFSALCFWVVVFLNKSGISELGGQLTCLASLFGRCVVVQTRSE